ncbi:hypothetical protein [Polaromonas sp.]|uniref:hypothetical protein n=1 Tax=Polaromonas sp. TaxID=1869339 RepID=UPI00352B64D7
MQTPLHTWLRTLLCCSAGALAIVPPAFAGTTVIRNAGGGNNHIEVTGNSAKNVEAKCAPGVGRRTTTEAPASVNSVDVDRRSLQGKTVIVTGRNTHDVRVEGDCQNGVRPNANVNSVNIR